MCIQKLYRVVLSAKQGRCAVIAVVLHVVVEIVGGGGGMDRKDGDSAVVMNRVPGCHRLAWPDCQPDLHTTTQP